eukprot:91160_1
MFSLITNIVFGYLSWNLGTECRVICESGDCNIDCALNGVICDEVICTNNSTSCTINCGNTDCDSSKFYLSASQYNHVICSGVNSCTSSNFYCGLPDNDDIPIGYTQSNFEGHIDECNFYLHDRSMKNFGTIKCFHFIDFCRVEVIGTGRANFVNSMFICELSPRDSKCSIHCINDNACGDSTSEFICNAPNCECIGDGCNAIIFHNDTAPPSTYMLGITLSPTIHPTTSLPSYSSTSIPTNSTVAMINPPIHVDSSNTLPVSNQTGTTWTSAFNSLQTALDMANDNDQIWIRKGIYYSNGNNRRNSFHFYAYNNVKIYGGFSGYETTIHERDYDNIHGTILSGNIGNTSTNIDNSFNVMTISNSNNCVLRDLTISDGYGHTRQGQVFGTGAGLRIFSSNNITINNIRISNNTVPTHIRGGGISVFDSFNTTIIDTTFDGNIAEYGGGIYAGGLNKLITIINTSFHSNVARSNGGGAYLALFRNINIINSSFDTNTAGLNGGGMYVNQIDSVNIIGTLFNGNYAKNGGGGIGARESQNIFVIESVFSYCSSSHGAALHLPGNINNAYISKCNLTQNTGYFGSIFLENTNNIHVSEINCSRNYAVQGGCIYYHPKNPNSHLFIEISTFESNIGFIYGGAISINIAHQLSYYIKNTSFNKNTAQFGGAIGLIDNTTLWQPILPVIINSNFFANEADIGGALYIESTSSSFSINQSYFDSNLAQNGGALYIDIGSEIITNIINTIFNWNYATYNGSAVFIYQSNNTTLNNCTFTSNECGQNGAVFISANNNKLYLNNCILNQNIATYGGAIYMDSNNNIPSTLEIISSKISQNEAIHDDGGGLYIKGVSVES